jgi:hypothetical protein
MKQIDGNLGDADTPWAIRKQILRTIANHFGGIFITIRSPRLLIPGGEASAGKRAKLTALSDPEVQRL